MGAFTRAPLAVRLPLIAAAMIFVVATGTTQLATLLAFQQQREQIERFGAIYLDGVSAAVLPYAGTGDSDGVRRALERAMQFHEGIRDQQVSLRAPDGREIARAALPGVAAGEPPVGLAAAARGFVLEGGSAWFQRALEQDGRPIGTLIAQLDISASLTQERRLRLALVALDLVLSALCAVIGFILVKRMLRPMAALAGRLDQASRGDLTPIAEAELGAPETEFGRLLRGFNRMAGAVKEREALMLQLAQQDKAAVLGRLAATMAHEVRNPLGGMTNAVETIRRYGDDPAVREQSLRLLERGLEAIGDVVRAALDTYRAPDEARQLSREDLDDLHALAEPEAQRRGVRLEWDVSVPAALPVNATETRQIVLNLLLNACVASPRDGRVRFSARVEDEALRMIVEDEGPGLPGPVLTRLEEPGAGREDGQGLGIGIVMRLVQSLRGRVAVSSDPASGTRVTLTIPLAEAR